MKRNILSTLCEIFFPIILMLLLYWLKSVFEIENHEFKEVEGTLDNFIKKRSVSNIDFSPIINSSVNISNASWNGMSILPALKICSNKNENKKERPIIATINVPEEIINTIINDSKPFEKDIGFNISERNFKPFKTVSSMDDYIKSSYYGEDENYPLICFGINFELKNSTENENENEYSYSLHYFENNLLDGAADIPSSQYLIDQFQSGPDMDSYEKYQENGYTYIMKVISDYILKKETNSTSKINFGILPMKYKSYRSDPFSSVIGFLGPFFIIIAYMGHLCIYSYKMVLEKETKAKEGMKIMGLTDGIYFMSYFIQFTVISLFDSLVNAIIFRYIFGRIPFVVFFFIFFLFSLNVFALAFFFQSFIDKAKESLIVSMLLYFIMFFLSLLVTNDDANYSMKVGLSLFPPVTIYIGIILLGKFESHFRTFHTKDIFHTYTNYSIIVMFIMLLVDIIIYLFLGYYLQNVLPHDYGVRKPWYFIFKKLFCIKSKKQKYSINYNKKENINNKEEEDDIFGNVPENENFQSEEIYKDMNKPKDALRIRNLVKKFDDGKVAVNNVDLNFYKNEIFALLGHNGAGKTTMISILTGLYQATGGEAIYDELNILAPENVDTFREKVGICPQHDVLFNDLNIREHLGMFAIFKGVSSENVEAEINKSIADFQFEDIQYTVAKNLSAGQRRKLSIAIALIGGSEIIFLDEPSSGMDITSRRNLWEILKRQSDNKIIILTTHYMEEASVLGKRIGIINLGKMKCIGTPLFLIEKFGKYMNITLNKEEGANNDSIMSFISQKVDQPQFESLSEEILARIPKDNFSKDSGRALNEFFEELDSNLENLKIKSYSVSMPTLEDVFLNIAAEDETDRISNIIREEQKYDEILFGMDYLDNFENKSKFISDFKANFIRRIYLMIRDKKGILMEILCPILLVLIGGLISQVKFILATPEFGNKDVSKIGKQIIYFSSLNNSIDMSNYYIKDYTNITSKDLDISYDNNEEEINNKSLLAIKKFIDDIYNKTIDSESSSDNEIDMNSEDYTGYYANFLLLNEPNDNNSNYEFLELINSRVAQGVPLYTSVFLEKIIQKIANKTIKINYTNKVMTTTLKQDLSSNSQSGTVIIFVAIAFALIPANFIAIIVREKNNNSKHLMRLSGLNILAYWIVNFIFELAKYYFTGGICLIILKLCDYYTPYLVYFYLLYGPPLICMTYVLSFLFTDESSAQNKMLLVHSLIGVLGSSTIIVLRGNEETVDAGKFLQYLFSLLPSFCFSFGYNITFNKIFIYMVEYPKIWTSFTDEKLIREFNLLLGPLLFLAFEIIGYLIILIIIEFFTYSNIFGNSTNNIILDEQKNKDEGVLKEEMRASQIELIHDEQNNNNILELKKYDNSPNPLEEKLDDKNESLIDENDNILEQGKKENIMVRIIHLRKVYRTSLYKLFCCCFREKGKLAVKNLSFCVEKGECFGLLGLNGAGKTTTFKCITQEINTTNGEIFINGLNTHNNFNLIKNKFGYCPQYDAIFEYLTVYENLEFYAKLKGVKEEFMDQIINALIREMRLQEFTKKMSGRLSGGNKRKLSVAISMLCNPPIILLDEPSTGMDPEARRFMWSVIHKMATKGKKSSIIMTTHSMDEAETLCKRMAIMVNGEFVCLGKANEIKDKYGYGYELNLRIKPMTEEQQNNLYFNKYNIDNKTIVRQNNLEEILSIIKKKNFMSEIDEERLGDKLLRDMKKNNGINITALLSWIFYVENAIRFIEFGRENFAKIIIEENMDNNFLFKMKKNEKDNKSIGHLFGLFEIHKEECFITEYSIQQTSLEQIFNKFAENQSSTLKERLSTIVERGDVENINQSETKNNFMENKIILTEMLSKQLLGNIEE